MTPDETIDKELLAAIYRCEDQLEEAIYEATKYLAATGRQSTAFQLVVRFADYTLHEEKKAFYRLTAGRLAEQAGEFAVAASVYRDGLATPTPDAETLYFLNNNLGYSLVQLEEFAEAEGFCREAIAIGPMRHNAHKNLGLSLQGQGEYLSAAECFLRAATLCPENTRAQEHLEDLLNAHPELAAQMPELQLRLKSWMPAAMPVSVQSNQVH